MRKILILFILLLPLDCLAQFTITGKIVNLATNKPVANASVFLNNATIGNESGTDGKFTLSGVNGGKYTLIVSVVGFETFSETIQVTKDTKLEDIHISPQIKALKEVVIRAKKDPNRELYLTMFKKVFLGQSELADQCRILNPNMLDLDYNDKTKILTASSEGFLKIENAALGYTIKYLLADFKYSANRDSPVVRYSGNILYEQMKGSPVQLRRWENERKEVYGNSETHFFRSLISGAITENGFKIQRYVYVPNPSRPPDSIINEKIVHLKKQLDIGYSEELKKQLKYWERFQSMRKMVHSMQPYPLMQPEVVDVTDKPGLYAFGCEMDTLYVTYNKNGQFPTEPNINHLNNPNNRETSLIIFNSPYSFIDKNGVMSDPYSLSVAGTWANNRVAQQLPIDYDADEIILNPVDSTVANKVTTKLESYITNHLAEKVYLHFDKPYYAAGDTLYFKAYVTLGERHLPSDLSGILHADLVTADNKIAQSLTLNIANGIAWGDFALPDSLTKGNYRVRAYTEYMRNENGTHFFDKTIPIGAVHGIKTASRKQITIPARPDVQFFPEGGTLVTGVSSRIAFKALGINGLGIDIKGEVIDNDNKQVCTFSSAHLGMGYFDLNPVEGKSYKAKVTYINGSQDVFNLPVAVKSGIGLTINNDSASYLSIAAVANQPYFGLNKGKCYTLAIYSGGAFTNIIARLDDTIISFDMLKQELHPGVSRITLFSPKGEPLCERLIFRQDDNMLKLKATADKTTYAKREKVTMKMSAVTPDNEPVDGDFSVSVTDEGKVPVDENAESTILNNLLLTSDLKGYVEQPNYYFSSTDKNVLRNLDMLMLTQGYRGFEWKQVLEYNGSAARYQPEQSVELSGAVTTLSGKPIANARVNLFSHQPFLAIDTTTDANGHFKFTGLNFSDTTKLVVSAANKNKKSNNVKITLDKPINIPELSITNPDSSANYITNDMETAMQKRYLFTGKSIILKEVNVKSTKTVHKSPLAFSSNLNGPGRADFVLMGDKFIGCTVLIDCLVGRLPGVKEQDGILYSVHTHLELNGPTQPIIVIVDGMQNEQSTGILNTITASDIYSIELLTSLQYLSIYGSNAAGGALVITTKRGGEIPAEAANPDASIHYTFNGFSKVHTFYSPKYDVAAPVNNNPDVRSTIYWNPEIVTDENGNASFDFYNADGPGTYRVVIEGMSTSGNLGRYVFHYTVN